MPAYYVKNKSGNVSDVTPEIYRQRLKNDEYECWVEGDDVPEEVQQLQEESQEPESGELPEDLGISTDYTAKEAAGLMADMDAAQREAFVGEDEDRVTVTKLLE